MSAKQRPLEQVAARASTPARAVRADDIVAELDQQLGEQSIIAIYRDKILTQRTRSYELRAPQRKLRVDILHTLLGIELKVGRRRLLCPDLATARYLSVFARLGCEAIALPYDITHISCLADELESSLQRTMLLIDHLTLDRSEQLRRSVSRGVFRDIRIRIAALGAGTKFPNFNQKTSQRA
jgi:hypothetical protein